MTFTLGYTTTPSSTGHYTQINAANQLAVAITAPTGGAQVQSISCYFGGYGQTTAAALCIWDTTGNLLTATPVFTAPGYGLSPGGQGWQTQSISYNLTPGQQVYIGWWRDHNASMVWSENSGALVEWLSTNTGSAPDDMTTNFAAAGVPGIYATCGYLGGIKTWGGTAWNFHPVKTWNGSTWGWHPVRTWIGTGWQHVG